jgi:hypothetical protein
MKKVICNYGWKTFEMDENLKKMKKNPQNNPKKNLIKENENKVK